ncbi:MAG: U32 family peptidase [Firmicutes bacterium]|nr:U32 family peptidase [Bacillota bacterium]
MKKNLELLAPAGNYEKLKAAFYFGADACYVAGHEFSLRKHADNFSFDELGEAVKFAHSLNKKIYVALNIFAHNSDFEQLKDYVKHLAKIKVDAVIVSDIGVFDFVRSYAPSLDIHISTQSNVTNYHSANFYASLGAKRIILSRELSLEEIKEIRQNLKHDVELEAFVHGAMCIAYSGRCLLSNFMANRPANKGDCAMSCRWEYSLVEATRRNDGYDISEDNRGTYILNSKDLNTLHLIDELIKAGISSFKIEGRMKTVYYVANIVNAYRRAIDGQDITTLQEELFKSSHRKYTTGFYLQSQDTKNTENFFSNIQTSTHAFVAQVIETKKDGVLIEQRNAFKIGDTLEVLSPNKTFNKKIIVTELFDEKNNSVEHAKLVQQKLFLKTDLLLSAGDILRKKTI